MIHRVPHFIVKMVTSSVAGGLIFLGQIIDEKTAVPLFTAVSAVVVIGALIWKMGTQYQALMDRLNVIEKTKTKPYDDTNLRAELSNVWAAVSGIKAEFSEVRTQLGSIKSDLRTVASERSVDMERLRKQLKTNALMDAVPNNSERTGMRLLLVEDNPDDLAILKRRLTPAFIVDECHTLAQANAKLKKQSYDCVLLDLRLPDARFNRTVEDFIADNPDSLCIVLSGCDDDATRKLCFDQGADDFWIKGVDDQDIRTIKRRITEANWRRHRASDELT